MNNKIIKFLIVIIIVLIIVIGFLLLFPYINNQEVKKEDVLDTKPIEQIQDTPTPKPSIKIIMFHNGTGPMCLDAIDFFVESSIQYQEYLDTEIDFQEKLAQYKENHMANSEGVSPSFSYYPIIFVGDRAFSGFNEDVRNEILIILNN